MATLVDEWENAGRLNTKETRHVIVRIGENKSGSQDCQTRHIIVMLGENRGDTQGCIFSITGLQSQCIII